MKHLIYAILFALILLIMTKQVQNYVFEDYFKAVFDKETDPTDIHKVIVDSGGVTKYGISDLADKIEDGKYFGEDIRTMSPERARQIYKSNYFTPYAQLFVAYPNFALHVFDVSINSGVGKAKELVNKSLGVDSYAKALMMISKIGESNAVNKIIQVRKDFYNSLAVGNPSKYAKYIKGWLNRVSTLKFIK